MEKRTYDGRVTRADVLVLVALGAVVLMMVPPLLSRPRERAARVVCRANLGQIGKAMFLYAKDYDEALPRSGGPSTMWGATANWAAVDRYQAFGINRPDESGGSATISSCFYLLVKYAQMPTRLFVCPDDKGTSEFKLSDLTIVPLDFELSDAWDFGPVPVAVEHCSYAYHMPFDPCALTTARDPNFAVAADRNPWIQSPAADPGNFADFQPDVPPWSASDERARAGNSPSHQQDGQNVLFLDGRVSFETRPHCAFKEDNIYTRSLSSSMGSACGTPPAQAQFSVANEYDSVLVHDPPTFGGTGSRQ